jgi:hypothetical protein
MGRHRVIHGQGRVSAVGDCDLGNDHALNRSAAGGRLLSADPSR